MPLRVTLLIAAPMKLPWRTSNGAMLTCTCSSDSSEIGATLVRSPGCEPRPKELLKYEPSTVMLLSRLSWPANEVPLACGVSRVTDSNRPEIVGSVRDVFAADRGRGAGSRRCEHRIAHAGHFDFFGDRDRLRR